MPLNSNSKLIKLLPAIYHESEHLGVLLSVFEKILYGENGSDQDKKRPRKSLGDPIPLVDSIATIACLFDADETPTDFLPWLASWVALPHFGELDEKNQRKLIAEIVPLYAFRGTKKYLVKMLEFFTPEKTVIKIEDQELGGFVVGKAQVGKSSRLAHDQPFMFRVEIAFDRFHDESEDIDAKISRYERQVRRVIELAKPAYTMYELVWNVGPNQQETR